MQARGVASITVAIRFSVSLLACAESLFLWVRLHLKLSRNVWHVAFLLLVLSVSVATVVPVTRPQTMTINSPWWLRVDPETLSCGFPNCCLTFTVYVEGTSYGVPVHVAFEGTMVHWDERFTTLGMPAPFSFTVTTDCAPLACPYEITVWAFDYVSPPIPKGEDLHNHTVKVKFVSGGGEPPCKPEVCPKVTYTSTGSWTSYTSWTAYTPWTYTTQTYNRCDWWDWWRSDCGVVWWPWTTGEEFDFSLNATPTSQSVKAGQSASFTTDVKLVSGAPQLVTLSLSGLPAGVSYSFSLPSADPSFTSALQVMSQASLSPGTYPLTVVGTGGGKTHSTIVNLDVAENKQSSSLSLSVSPPSLKVGESVALGGALSPGLATTVELVYTRPDGFELVKHVTTSSAGAFSDAFKPDMPGPWSVKARWPGDADHYAGESQTQSFYVEPPPEQPPSLWDQIARILPTVALLAVLLVVAVLAVVLLRRRSAHKLKGATAVKARFCTKCGTTIPEGSGYCPRCGEKT